MTEEKLDEYLKEADKRMKQNNGHIYVIMLKTRCQYCGRSPRQTGKCKHWFQTFIDKYRQVLRENGELT
jgi:hypothetical protein